MKSCALIALGCARFSLRGKVLREPVPAQALARAQFVLIGVAEAADLHGGVAVRDRTVTELPVVVLARRQWLPYVRDVNALPRLAVMELTFRARITNAAATRRDELAVWSFLRSARAGTRSF